MASRGHRQPRIAFLPDGRRSKASAVNPEQHSAPLKILVAICTFNRAHLLAETLTYMQRLQRPEGVDLRFVVVNNCCTDHTDDVVTANAGTLPLEMVREPKPGLSNARNRAIEVALTGGADYIIWTDDDVRPNPDWLVAYTNAIRRNDGVAVLGGLVDPWFEAEPPQWITANWEHLRYAFAVRDLGPEEHRLDPVKGLPFGANFATRVEEQARHRYDPRLGVVKGKRLAGEETVVMKSILAEGHFGLWLPQAKVRHYIERERLTLRYLTRYFYGAGASASRARVDNSQQLLGRPRWLFGAAVRQSMQFVSDLLLWRREHWVVSYTDLLFAFGRLSEPAQADS